MLAEHGRRVNVKIALEPLHPVYAADRSCLSLLSEALDICDAIEGKSTDPWLGTLVDVYHLWWDPNLQAAILRAPVPPGASSVFMSATGWCPPTMFLTTVA